MPKPLGISGLYYSHGLFCANHPHSVITFAAFAVIVCSLPFFITPSGDFNSPKPWRSPWLNYRIPSRNPPSTSSPSSTLHPPPRTDGAEWIINNATQFSLRTPSWFVGLPLAVIQQVYVEVDVNCQDRELLCKQPSYSASKTAAAHIFAKMKDATRTCHSVAHPAVVKFTQYLLGSDATASPFPGALSPVLDPVGHSWDEGSLSYQTIKELLYGGFWERQPSAPPPSHPTRTHTFSLTFVLEPTREKFSALTNCVQALQSSWQQRPQSGGAVVEGKEEDKPFMKHFFYEPEWHLLDFAPLLGLYFIVFLYISFSVGKIDLVKSKVGLGITACITVIASLTMSLGICTFFGFSITVSGSEIYPFVVVIIGLENILIIVKAVMSTPEEMDVRERIAAGLSHEGAAITKNLATHILMTSLGIVFFNYTMKEFCIIALVGLLCDCFLQLLFFPTVLSIDLRRLELSDLPARQPTAPPHPDSALHTSPCPCPPAFTPQRWLPKRMKFAYFLANVRLFSRALTILILAYLIGWLTNSDALHRFVGFAPWWGQDGVDFTAEPPGQFELPSEVDPMYEHAPGGTAHKTTGSYWRDVLGLTEEDMAVFRRPDVDGFALTCEGELCWRPLVTAHWPTLLQRYGYDLEGRFLTLLPPISLNFLVGFDKDKRLHSQPELSMTNSLLLSLSSHPLFLRILFLAAFATTTISYFTMLVRATMRRYWKDRQVAGPHATTHRIITLCGHTQDVECLCVSSGRVFSAGLDGEIRVWDHHTLRRRPVLVISRREVCANALLRSPGVRIANEGSPGGNSTTPTFPTLPAGLTTAATGVTLPASLAMPINVMLTPSSAAPTGIGPSPLQAGLPPLANAVPIRAPSGELVSHRLQTSDSVQGVSSPGSAALQLRSSVEPGPSPWELRSQPPPPLNAHPPSSSCSLHSHSPSPDPLHRRLSLPPSTPPPSTPPHKHAPQSGAALASTKPAPPSDTRPAFFRYATPPPSPAHTALRKTSSASTVMTAHPSPPPPSPSLLPASHPPTPLLVPPPLSPRTVTSPRSSPPQVLTQPSLPPLGPHTLTSPPGASLISEPRPTQSYTRAVSSTTLTEPRPPPVRPVPHFRGNVGSLSRRGLGSAVDSRSHTRSKSAGSFFHGLEPPRNSSGRVVSILPPVSASPLPDDTVGREQGYNFLQHFNIFSPFTSDLALEFASGQSEEEEKEEDLPPPVWCMDVSSSGVITVGCGNGQVEAWDASSGSLTFCVGVSQYGVTNIAVTGNGILTGHMDGSLQLIGHNGRILNSIQAHEKPVSVLKYCGDKVITGSYDSVVLVHRTVDFFCLNSVEIHRGGITALALVGHMAACISGCSNGLVCFWELTSGNCIHEFAEYGNTVIQVACSGDYLLALFSEGCVRVWGVTSGLLIHSIDFDGICQDFAVLGSRYFAVNQEFYLAIYDLETGIKHSERPIEQSERSISLIRHTVALDNCTLVCSLGGDIQIVPCNLKAKTD